MRLRLDLQRLAAIAVVAGLAVLLPSRAGADEPLAKVDIGYDVTIAGAAAAEIAISAKLNTDTYRVAGEGRTTGLIDLLVKMRFAGTAKGKVNGGGLAPVSHVHNYSERGRARQVSFSYDRRGMPKVSASPPFDPSRSRVPLPQAMYAGTIDPVSVFVVPAVPGKGPLAREQCERNFAVLDGQIRIDMRLTYLGTGGDGSLTGSTYHGPVVRCRAMVNPVGGHKRGEFLTKLSQADDVEVWLAPAAGARYLVPVRVSLPTPIGRAEMLARRLVDRPAGD